MRRQTIGSASHSARLGSGSRATTRKVDHSTIFPTADLDAGRNDSPKGVPIVQPYGFAYWPAKQDEEEEQQQGQQKQQSSGSGPSDQAGAGAFEDDDQPKGKSAIGLTNYANGSRSDPNVQNLQDPRHQLMLENEKQQQQEGGQGGQQGGGQQQGGQGGGKDYGGREGDTAMYHMADKAIQLHFAGGDEKSGLKAGAYLSTRADKNKIRLQLVNFDDGGGGSQQQQGGGAQTGGGQQKQQKKEGQRPLLKNDSTIYIDIDGGGNTTTVRHGDCYVILTGDRVVSYYKDEKKSHLVDDEHIHMRFMDLRIWIDKEGIWSTIPIMVKQDEKDKN